MREGEGTPRAHCKGERVRPRTHYEGEGKA